ncbi:MAG: 4-hydroxythreonine-4-phosphate dehydrogenase PdxA [Sphingomonadales bacterium]|nr:4-hydroxythreonine-4-phosphate dehydrogenase PdxA [Sphingomonadales bacterium]
MGAGAAIASSALAVSLGDPAGVGPELLAEAWARREAEHLGPFFAVGGERLLAEAAALRGLDIEIRRVASPEAALAAFPHALPVLGEWDGDYRPGEPSRGGAGLALASLTEATRLAVTGAAAGVVTGPIAKSRLAEVGFGHPGQTEFVAEACGYDPGDVVMMLAGPNLRTVPLTVHIPLSEVPRHLTEACVERRGRITALALMRDFGIAAPRLAFAALNPHAGEDGRMGDEEARIIAPALARLRAEGIDATGPFAADGLFAPRARATYDVALCAYHDQALIPLKALDFDSGVNVTLGLPIIRTSPDHGTAFAIAGKRLANAGATIASIRMAGECAARRLGR